MYGVEIINEKEIVRWQILRRIILTWTRLVHKDRSKVDISQNFVSFSEDMNFFSFDLFLGKSFDICNTLKENINSIMFQNEFGPIEQF